VKSGNYAYTYHFVIGEGFENLHEVKEAKTESWLLTVLWCLYEKKVYRQTN